MVRALRALDFTLISQHFSKKLIRWSYMSLETGQILQDIGLSATISQLWGQNRLSLAAIPSPRTAGGCPPHARGGVVAEDPPRDSWSDPPGP